MWQMPDDDACVVAEADKTIEEQFREQAEKWDYETSHLSSPAQRLAHPSYVAILGMANDHREEVIDLLLQICSKTGASGFGRSATSRTKILSIVKMLDDSTK